MIDLVVKIGGSLFKNPNFIFDFIDFIKKLDKKSIIIISAFSNTTSKLKEIAEESVHSLHKSKELLDVIIDFHLNFLDFIQNNNLKIELQNEILEINLQINNLLKGISITKELTNKTLDKVMSFGELLALKIISYIFLDKQISFSNLNYKLLIVTDNNYNFASPNINLTEQRLSNVLLPSINQYNLFITQGFVAQSDTGNRTTMGFESSNYSAVVFASLLKIKKVIFITDVEGILTADPKLVNKTYLIENISYRQAYDYAKSGLKLLFPEMIELAEKNSIELIYKSINSEKNTLISKEISNLLPLILIQKVNRKFENQLKNLDIQSIDILKTTKFEIINGKIYHYEKIYFNHELDKNNQLTQNLHINIKNYSISNFHKFINSFLNNSNFENVNLIEFQYFPQEQELLLIIEILDTNQFYDIINRINEEIVDK